MHRRLPTRKRSISLGQGRRRKKIISGERGAYFSFPSFSSFHFPVPSSLFSSLFHRPAELRCRGIISVEQSSCCSTETRDDSIHFQETTKGLSVPHLMCWQTEGTITTARRCCGVFVILAPDTNLQICRSGGALSDSQRGP